MRPDEARAVAERLRAGLAVPDARFDALLSPGLRTAAGVHFTPVAVALRAAAWLVGGGADEVLDLGAGAGKLCLVGAAATGARFVGVEARPALVAEARRLARAMGLPNAQFVRGDVREVPLGGCRALYAFAPFDEAGAEPFDWLDALPPTDPAEGRAFLRATLAAAPAGARAALYCGTPGEPPPGWRAAAVEGGPDAPLALWARDA